MARSKADSSPALPLTSAPVAAAAPPAAPSPAPASIAPGAGATAADLPLVRVPLGSSPPGDVGHLLISQIVELAQEVGSLRAQIAAGAVDGLQVATRAVLQALAGEAPALPPGPLRDACARVAELRKRPAAVPEEGGAPASRVLRLVEQAATSGVVPDDLAPGPLPDLLHGVAALWRAQAEAHDRADAARREALDAQAAAKRHFEELQALRAAPPADPALAKKVKDLERELAGVKLVKDRQEKELTARTVGYSDLERRAAEAERRAGDLAGAFALVAEAAGLPADSRPEDIVAHVRDRLAAQPAPPAVEPPPMREAAWTEIAPGELALDRAALRRLNEHHQAGIEPSDPERRVLALRVGSEVAWLRGDGLWADGTPFDEAQRIPARRFRDWLSRRAIVIAEGLSGDPGEIAAAFRSWVERAKATVGLEVALADEAPATPAA